MSNEYLNKLKELCDELNLEEEIELPIEIKYFFNGAAFYAGGNICISLSPVGLACKLPEAEVKKITSGQAKPLKYFLNAVDKS